MGLMTLPTVNVCSGIKKIVTVKPRSLSWTIWLNSGLICPTNQQTTIIWDGASWHGRADIVREAAETLGFILIQLPAYSPDLNPIEGLWKWLREELTQHHSYKYLYQLERACFDFIDRINLDPEAIISRLWPKFDLDPEYEKVMFSP
jgi:transposase